MPIDTTRERSKEAFEQLNAWTDKGLTPYKTYLSIYLSDIFVEFQRDPLVFFMKYPTHTLNFFPD